MFNNFRENLHSFWQNSQYQATQTYQRLSQSNSDGNIQRLSTGITISTLTQQVLNNGWILWGRGTDLACSSTSCSMAMAFLRISGWTGLASLTSIMAIILHVEYEASQAPDEPIPLREAQNYFDRLIDGEGRWSGYKFTTAASLLALVTQLGEQGLYLWGDATDSACPEDGQLCTSAVALLKLCLFVFNAGSLGYLGDLTWNVLRATARTTAQPNNPVPIETSQIEMETPKPVVY